MTCDKIRALLDDYVDNELPADNRDPVLSHLEQCPACSAEHEETLKLRKLLRLPLVPPPGDEYFGETASLIMARTIGSESPGSEQAVHSAFEHDNRRAFLRSLISAAASVMIFVSALVIGASREQQPIASFGASEPLLVASSLAERLGEDFLIQTAREEQLSLIAGMFLTGPPGLLGGHSELASLKAAR